jgi:hypothetical protein
LSRFLDHPAGVVVDARETGTLVYTLGQLGCGVDLLSRAQLIVLSGRILVSVDTCNGQGVSFSSVGPSTGSRI